MTEGKQFSGAIIRHLSEHETSKTAEDSKTVARLHQQADYMTYLNMHGNICPRILRYLDDGYVMERMDSFKFILHREVRHYFLFAVKKQLNDQLWTRGVGDAAIPKFDRARLVQYVSSVMHDFDFSWQRINTVRSAIQHEYSTYWTPSVIHGDCTLNNLLTQFNNHRMDCYMTDPIPPDERIPSDRAVDLGKLIQSALGWDGLFVTGEWFHDGIDRGNALFDIETTHTQRRAWLWCLIHLIRILPYTDGHAPYIRQKVHEQTREIISYIETLYGGKKNAVHK